MKKRWWKILLAVVGVFLVVGIIGSALGDDAPETTDAVTETSTTSSEPPSSSAAPSSTLSTSPARPVPTTMPAGCEKAPDRIVQTIKSSLKDPAWSIANAYTVKGDNGLTYVSATILLGGDRKHSAETWAEREGVVFSLSSNAREKSRLADGRKLLSASAGDDDGYRSHQCVVAALRAQNQER